MPALKSPVTKKVEAMPLSGVKLIAAKAKTLPAQPGVYRMIGSGGKILYIGKARHLKKRVAQYKNLARQSARIARMITLTKDMEFTLTRSEPEALLLEARMIKRHRPPFNILLRDDKSFPFIELNQNHEAARLSKHRGRQKENCEYFGPFVSADAVDRTLIALQKAFLLRSCSDNVYAHRARPCLLYQIKRCAAPCTEEISLENYRRLTLQARDFLKGKSRDIQKKIAAQMDQAARQQDYERAALYRDRLRALEQIQMQPGSGLTANVNADLFAIHREGSASCVQLFIVRAGQNLGNRSWFPKHHAQDSTEDILASFIAQFYDSRKPAPLILVNHALSASSLLSQALTIKAERKTQLVWPRKGSKKQLLREAETNARAALARHRAEAANQSDMAKRLGQRLGLPQPPERIEVYDNSHIQGSQPVGAMVVAGLEGFLKPHYRIFNIDPKKLTAGDDYAMMRQVFQRRFDKKKIQDGRPMPDLIIIDGGRGQISSVRPILAEADCAHLPILGIAKGPARGRGGAVEHFFFASCASGSKQNKAFTLDDNDPLLYHLQRLRDEAHRFAITRHRARRKKAAMHNPLDDISGIGAQRKRNLLQRFGSAKAAARASYDELQTVEGISQKLAKTIHDHFQSTNS